VSLDVVAEALAGRIAEVLRHRFVLLVNQKQSGLGVACHVDAVLRRIACGEPGAVLLDGQYLLTLDAAREELAMQSARQGLAKRRAVEGHHG